MKKEKILEWLGKYKSRIFFAVVIIAVLVIAFCMGEEPAKKAEIHSGGNVEIGSDEEFDNLLSSMPSSGDNQEHEGEQQTEQQDSSLANPASESTDYQNPESQTKGTDSTIHSPLDITEAYTSAATSTDTAIQHVHGQEEQQTQQISTSEVSTSAQQEKPKQLTCTFSISCSTILDNMDKLDRDKKGLVPADGWILKPITVEYQQGETVFDVLKRVCQDRKIHMESSWTPMYNSAYIEGIHNLYEFDCGSLSGWMYCVNGVFNNYGCSKAVIQNGDIIEWVYTCDLGKDVQK